MSDSIRSQFESRYNVTFSSTLGIGRDGYVFVTQYNTAVKFFAENAVYARERRAYEILRKLNIETIGQHSVPQLLLTDDELLAIELSIVKPPFFLDFASAYHPADVPDFPDDVWENWFTEKQEEFGDRWPQVQFLMNEFERLTGLILLDVNPGNIKFS